MTPNPGTNPPTITEQEDELIIKAQSGDHAAFGELMSRTGGASLRQATSILRNHHELAEEEVQNAYLKAWLHIDQFQGKSKFSTWITRIVMNQCLMRLRSLRMANFVSLDGVINAEGDLCPTETVDCGVSPEAAVCGKQQAGTLKKEIGRLSPRLRRVLVLRDMNELSTQEAASRLGISTAAVKSRLLRARLELRRRLTRIIQVPIPVAMGHSTR